MHFNRPLPKSFFSDVIPEDAMVSDGINHLVYVYGDRTSIGGLLNDTVRSKRVMIFRYISVTLGLVMVIIALVMKYREYRKRKNSK